jgi:hypothetical protein
MSNSLRQEIRDRMKLKETGELLEIWQNNDRAEWSDEAFHIIQEILKERDVDIPEQNQPIDAHTEIEKDESYNFNEQELKIIEDENPPAFYDPFEVLLTTKRIDLMAKVMIGFILISNLINFPRSLGIVQSYFISNPNSVLIYLVTSLLVLANAGLAGLIAYFPLTALSRILRIFMEMEFRSRKAI